MNYNWAPLIGKFDIGKSKIRFLGVPATFKNTQTGKEDIGDSLGELLSDCYFSEGKISAEVTFEHIDSKSSCEIMFYYDSKTGDYLGGGISGAGGLYGLNSYIGGKLEFYKQTGEHVNLKEGKMYLVELEIKGNVEKLFVDRVEVLSHVLNFPLKISQVGLFCFSQSNVLIKNFKVEAKKSEAFVIMEYEGQFNELYEEVIRDVCSKQFGLEVVRADEIYGPGVILSDIAQHINNAKVVIAEITPVNANVFYEVGYSHAMNKPTILIAEKGTELPFDVSPFRVLFYTNTIAGKRKVQEGLSKHLDSILNK